MKSNEDKTHWCDTFPLISKFDRRTTFWREFWKRVFRTICRICGTYRTQSISWTLKCIQAYSLRILLHSMKYLTFQFQSSQKSILKATGLRHNNIPWHSDMLPATFLTWCTLAALRKKYSKHSPHLIRKPGDRTRRTNIAYRPNRTHGTQRTHWTCRTCGANRTCMTQGAHRICTTVKLREPPNLWNPPMSPGDSLRIRWTSLNPSHSRIHAWRISTTSFSKQAVFDIITCLGTQACSLRPIDAKSEGPANFHLHAFNMTCNTRSKQRIFSKLTILGAQGCRLGPPGSFLEPLFVRKHFSLGPRCAGMNIFLEALKEMKWRHEHT